MAYRTTVKVSVRDNGAGEPPTCFYDPKDRRRAWIWFGPDAPDWVRDGDRVMIEKTGLRRPSWRIVERAQEW